MKAMVSLLCLVVALNACRVERSYPEGMTAAERKAYYDDFNNSRTTDGWEEIGESRAERPPEPRPMQPQVDRNPHSIAVRIRNNGLLPRRVKIADNVLDFKPFETRYVGFEAGTRVYLLRGGGHEFLFEITPESRNQQFSLLP